MIWAFASSAYIIYLYRKLKAENSRPEEIAESDPGGPEVDLDRLEKRIGSIEAQLADRNARESVR